MAVPSEEQLASVQSGIVEIETNGQSVTVDGIEYRAVDLDVL